MKKIVQINGINYGSTGKIMLNIARMVEEDGMEPYIFCRNSIEGKKHPSKNLYYIGTWLDRVISERLSYALGLNGYFNIINTFMFLRELDRIGPSLVHIHSLCDNYLNVNMLFKYLRKKEIPVVWTLHDSWAFTGRCAQNRCEKWRDGCGNCPHKDYYPGTLFLDNSAMVWKKRDRLYKKLSNLTMVTPSKWLSERAKQSHFKDNDIRVINNGIDLNLFKPSENSTFRKDHHLEDKFIILGLAYYWDESKGLNDFLALAKDLPEDIAIVMVGTNDEVDKVLPDNIISIHRTQNQQELVEIYSAVDLFVNPTNDENFPTVNIEALACGLPVLTYRAGGSAEMLSDLCGCSVDVGDYSTLLKEIIRIYTDRPYSRENCISQAAKYNMTLKFREYVDLYQEKLK